MPICREGMEMWMQRVDSVGEGESGVNGESSITIYTLPCVKWTGGEKLP